MEPESPNRRYAEVKDSLDRIRRALGGSVTPKEALAHLDWIEFQVDKCRWPLEEMDPGCGSPVSGNADNRIKGTIPRKGK